MECMSSTVWALTDGEVAWALTPGLDCALCACFAHRSGSASVARPLQRVGATEGAADTEERNGEARRATPADWRSNEVARKDMMGFGIGRGEEVPSASARKGREE